ncbi:MAG: hypothetical protein QN141_05715 [Armatimonadota bacterium]|nr:hypothetical protein [Armatimonadota bacterium]MDR7452220.1 hypothetical protein [Armatimonadota bacterium]MDR7466685.1 hypothetical protein [Armatimonadota bacterium]MDR7492841.1 hypothetical protein [Armatimonadota bacterium]MDR7498617.1 hypothetical protein [Armatimonadota bacterium]
MPWMPPQVAKFFTYWSLTFAVFLIYLFSFVVAGLDVWASLMESVRKRRKELPPLAAYDPNPLAGKTVASTLGLGPGQQPDGKRRWVLDRAAMAARRLGLDRLHVVVLEDSKEHPLVHFHDGRTLVSYRVDKTWVAEARAGNAERERQVVELLERYLASDFLGRHELRPKRTTELARGKEA